MNHAAIDLSPLRSAHALLREAIDFWEQQPADSPLKPHLRSAVIQSFEFTYELALHALRRVLVERAESAERVTDLSFNDLLRTAADAGLLADPAAWRRWREMRNTTSHAYDQARAQAVAESAAAFTADSAALLSALEAAIVGRA